MKLAKWASIYHENLRVDYPLTKPYLLEAGGIGGGVPLNFHEVYNLRVSLMFFNAHLPPAILRQFVTFWAADAELKHDSGLPQLKGWFSKGDKAQGSGDQRWVTYGIAVSFPIIMVFCGKWLYLKGNDPIGETLF